MEQLYGRGTDVVPATRNWSPRIGFNYDLSPSLDVRQQVRGGLGLFHGRTPYVWLSNQYSNTGNDFQRIRVFFDPYNRMPFSADPHDQPTDIGSASTNEINLVDPDYRYPQLLRGNLAYDRDLGFFNLIGSVELLFVAVSCATSTTATSTSSRAARRRMGVRPTPGCTGTSATSSC